MDVPAISVLMTGGSQSPVIPLSEVSGNAGAVLYWQSGPISSNSGIISVTMSTSIEVWTPHCPGSLGVNVKVNVPGTSVFMTAGFQSPVIPSREISGRAGGVLYWHSGPIVSNVGMISDTTEMTMEASRTHGYIGSGVKMKKKVPRVEYGASGRS